MKISKVFKITLKDEDAAAYKHAHSDYWIQDFFKDFPAVEIVEVKPKRKRTPHPKENEDA